MGEKIARYFTGINASEGMISVPYRLNDEKSVPVPDSMFYEFLPTDADDDFSKIVTIDQLETGKEYEVIVTNLSGFYRFWNSSDVLIRQSVLWGRRQQKWHSGLPQRIQQSSLALT